ncbi:MAG: sirohydrochlorin cobaltochelatase [Muribaculaceae bacterium]|nr:sirohydrochlorin cobaltochelatase [Muribaculaceae bacterium]
MKKILLLLILLTSITIVNAGDLKDSPAGRTAILMVHFGTTIDETRELTIETLNEKVKATFPGITVEEAYIPEHGTIEVNWPTDISIICVPCMAMMKTGVRSIVMCWKPVYRALISPDFTRRLRRLMALPVLSLYAGI